ncbi:hypothetical protein NQ317_007957 [Molorchus minor]|uniref:Uncharacterized protein n=1 Tax=Molorchus minor TaxID=1323400 RepID=A0ABQ9JZT6_9CUCU|nr:hypothetical protein NQ317_007957 [Molorchus minor]
MEISFLKNWEKCFPLIVAFLQKDGHIKDKAVKALLDNAFKETCDENGKYASILLAIHGYLVPSANFVKKCIWKDHPYKVHHKRLPGIIFYIVLKRNKIEEHIMP